MTETESDTPDTEATEPVRIPNVHAHAVSGLDHAPLGAESHSYADAEVTDEGTNDGVVDLELPDPEPTFDDGGEVTVIAGTPEERLAWVKAADSEEERSARAGALYTHEKDAGASNDDLEALGAQLREAVYGDPEDPEDAKGTDDGTDPDAADQKTEGSDDGTVEGNSIPGAEVESDTAGTGEAVNAATGEVTQPGEPLPTIEQDSGTPLETQAQPTSEQPDSTIQDDTIQKS